MNGEALQQRRYYIVVIRLRGELDIILFADVCCWMEGELPVCLFYCMQPGTGDMRGIYTYFSD